MLKKLVLFFLILSFSYLSAAATSAGRYYVSSKKLNIRLAPDLNGKYFKTIYKDKAVTVFEIRNGWARISRYETDEKGHRLDKKAQWVYAKFLSSKEPPYKYKTYK